MFFATVMSSHDSVSVVLKCMLKGAVDFLVKPVRKNELQNLWQHVWRKHCVCSSCWLVCCLCCCGSFLFPSDTGLLFKFMLDLSDKIDWLIKVSIQSSSSANVSDNNAASNHITVNAGEMSETGENSDEGNHTFVSCFDFFFLYSSSSPDQKLLLEKILPLLKSN